MNDQEAGVIFTVKCPIDLATAFDRLAEREHRSRSAQLRLLMERHVQESQERLETAARSAV